MTPLLDTISHPQDLKKLSIDELKILAQEIRSRIIDVLSQTGGHLSSNLGIVELTIALHRTFESPKDKFIFDVGHQSYVHKLLTGRNPRFPTIRQSEGLSGFIDPKESPHDLVYTGHAGNALSLALGMAKNRDLRGKEEMIVPILGDAALTCGLTLEAMNNIPRKLKNFTVILNDNAMSISKNVGAITNILSRFFNSPTANNIYEDLAKIVSKIPGYGETLAKHGHALKESMKNLISTAPFFEQFGLSYVGPIDGHDIKKLTETLEALKEKPRPTIVHVLTVKGQGLKHAINNPTPFHGARPFNRVTGEFHPPKKSAPSFPKIFGTHLTKLAEEDPSIVAVTPAMPVGSCIDSFMKKMPGRCIDVGIAEGHSLSYAGGIALNGKLKVVASIYSSFMQRALDNIYHDICIQNSPVVIAVDRAGLATGDGVSAQGLYDIPYLNAMPNMVICQPRNGHVLKELVSSAFDYRKPTAIRYPNLPTIEEDLPLQKRLLGKGEVLAEGKEMVIVALGHMSAVAMELRALLAKEGIEATVIDPVFIKPLDEALLKEHFQSAHRVVTLEEHSIQGGLGSIINSFIVREKMAHLTTYNYGLPDELIEHGSHSFLLKKYGLDANALFKKLQHCMAPV